MMRTTASTLVGALAAVCVQAIPQFVDETFPYLGPDVPVGDWLDTTINGDGKGFVRLYEAPAVTPATSNPTNNINVIALAYVPGGINIHFQTAFGLGVSPSINYGTSSTSLSQTATGVSTTYEESDARIELQTANPKSPVATIVLLLVLHTASLPSVASGFTISRSPI